MRRGSVKQVIVLRMDLDVSVGKMIAQACHASLGAAEVTKEKKKKIWRRWIEEGGKKIVLACRDEDELERLHKKAEELGIPCYLVVDMGLTEVPPGTKTALGIGPDESELIDKVTGTLPLVKGRWKLVKESSGA